MCLHACACMCVSLCHGTHVVVGKQLLGVHSRLAGESQGLRSSCPSGTTCFYPLSHLDSPLQKTLKYSFTPLLTPLQSLLHTETQIRQISPVASWLFPEYRLKCTGLQMLRRRGCLDWPLPTYLSFYSGLALYFLANLAFCFCSLFLPQGLCKS